MKQNFSSTQKIGPRESNLNQVIDVIQEDISGSSTRRKYETFVTGGIGPGVTSSIYQTVYDQDFTLQTANPILDFTMGLYYHANRDNLVTKGTGYTPIVGSGQIVFDSTHTMMMREKVNVYRQYAKMLLNNADAPFTYQEDVSGALIEPSTIVSNSVIQDSTGVGISDMTCVIDAALFVNVKRLFARDGIRKETFAFRIYRHAPLSNDGNQGFTMSTFEPPYDYTDGDTANHTPTSEPAAGDQRANIFDRGGDVFSSEEGVQIIADLEAVAKGVDEAHCGHVSALRLAADPTKVVGLLYHEAGIAVLNLGGSTLSNSNWSGTNKYNNSNIAPERDVGWGQSNDLWPILSPHDRINGLIDGMQEGLQNGTAFDGLTQTAGEVFIGQAAGSLQTDPAYVAAASFYPDLLVSASIDDIVDHIGYTRFSSGSLTGMAFQNETSIYSTIFFCTAEASEFNQSNNSTYTAISPSPDKTFITTVLLYADQSNEPVAVAKLNRPIEKTPDSSLTVRVRLDF